MNNMTYKEVIKKTTSLFLTMMLSLSVFPGTGTLAASKTEVKAFGGSVQSYKKESASFKLTTLSRFYITSLSKPDNQTVTTVKLLDSEFAAKKVPSTKPLKIVYGSSILSKPGDIVIDITSGYGKEEYKLEVGTKVKVKASTADGLFYGLRALLKYRLACGSNTMPGMTVKDKPDVNERTVNLDCGRKFFSKTWIKNFIKKSSWQGYNALELHFSEDQALRIKSKKYPWTAGSMYKNQQSLTFKDVESIIKVANLYHMEIIPSFDSPGHLNYLTKKYKNYVRKHPNFKFTYKGKPYSKKNKGFKNISNYFSYKGKRTGYTYLGIDLANPVAVAFASSLIDEYATFFKKQGCTKFNIGGDELNGWNTVTLKGKTFNQQTKWKALEHWSKYARKKLHVKNGSASDTYINYMNKTASRLEKWDTPAESGTMK